MTIFVAQYINTAIMFILAYHSFLASADVDMNDGARHFLVGPFDEFNVRWYLVVGVPIVLSIAM